MKKSLVLAFSMLLVFAQVAESANEYYSHGSFPAPGSPATSASMRAELDLITAGFDKLPVLTGNALRAVIVNSGGTGLTLTTGQLALGGNLTLSGAFNLTLIQGASVSLTLPTSNDTLVGRATTDTLTNKTLTTPIIASILTNGGAATLTLPTTTDTLVGRATTDTFTNKTFTNPANTAQALTDGATVNWDASSGAFATWTIGGNRTLAAPTNLKTGGFYILIVTQDGTGGRTITWNAVFKGIAGASMPAIQAAAGAVTAFKFVSPNGTDLYLLDNGDGAYRSVQVFTASGTWTRPVGCRRVKVRIQGGGGAGGGAAGTASNFSVGGGGGSGGYGEKTINVTTISSATITVGSGGTGVSGGSGNNGMASSWSDGTNTVTGSGGNGGVASATGSEPTASGGGGASSSGGDWTFTGAGSGHKGFQRGSGNALGGNGAESPIGGGGGRGAEASATGEGAQGYGGGGGGSANNGGQGALSGGAGASGIVIIEEYY